MEKWEYTYMVLEPQDVEDKLNGKGRRGWEVVSCTPLMQELQADTQQGPVKVDVVSYHVVLKKPMGKNPEDEG